MPNRSQGAPSRRILVSNINRKQGSRTFHTKPQQYIAKDRYHAHAAASSPTSIVRDFDTILRPPAPEPQVEVARRVEERRFSIPYSDNNINIFINLMERTHNNLQLTLDELRIHTLDDTSSDEDSFFQLN